MSPVTDIAHISCSRTTASMQVTSDDVRIDLERWLVQFWLERSRSYKLTSPPTNRTHFARGCFECGRCCFVECYFVVNAVVFESVPFGVDVVFLLSSASLLYTWVPGEEKKTATMKLPHQLRVVFTVVLIVFVVISVVAAQSPDQSTTTTSPTTTTTPTTTTSTTTVKSEEGTTATTTVKATTLAPSVTVRFYYNFAFQKKGVIQ